MEFKQLFANIQKEHIFNTIQIYLMYTGYQILEFKLYIADTWDRNRVARRGSVH